MVFLQIIIYPSKANIFDVSLLLYNTIQKHGMYFVRICAAHEISDLFLSHVVVNVLQVAKQMQRTSRRLNM